ncbi:UDP-N-acetylglucosamine--N-acetylmuramyl-(pentapeptide) pyrophosphoryl-undecaprenol N-acetylglucosamine transferase [Patescibacteria group bacterium]|nr:UDP-N-acetylglucosamine--N-acetylmuramyl-(pentapeptide) pyrophosphoryl-undecaprenol N-acetylglucosamine transferase [Patescibacteria group bacterium]
MKILLTGGGSGGHFYPIIAVTQSLNKIIKDQKLVDVDIYYMAPQPYDARALFENNLKFVRNSAGKKRRYFYIFSFIDYIKTAWGILTAIWTLFWIYPDVVFGKGGYVSFPALFAARFFRIPVVIHESDSYPGRVNLWAGKFARKIAVSYPEASQYFSHDKVAHTGNPIRLDILHSDNQGSIEFLGLEEGVPTVLILGGSQGSELINDVIIDILPQLVSKYNVVHQTGPNNYEIVKNTAQVVLMKSEHKHRYKSFDHLNSLSLRMAAGASQLIVSRAGSTIFEIAIWGIPSILIPITESNGNHQRKNAYSYARTGAAEVIEENNLTSHIVLSEIDRIMADKQVQDKMKTCAKIFSRIDAADKIAAELIEIGLEHEK